MKSIHVVIALIFNEQKQILIAQRQSHQEKGGTWEFPGGKVEVNETAFAALQRELNEEIGINISKADRWTQVEYHYPHKSVLLDTWMVKEFSGTPRGAEGQPIDWIDVTDLLQREFPEGNKLVIEKLLEDHQAQTLFK
jgi:8-oxo-dGTP diphosphatase